VLFSLGAFMGKSAHKKIGFYEVYKTIFGMAAIKNPLFLTGFALLWTVLDF
jgi:hypothetical protein